MKTGSNKPSRMMQEIQSLARDMHDNGTLDDATFRKITMREFKLANSAELPALSGEEIRALREQAHMSQAVFAKTLNLTVGYISELEREVKRPTGAALALLDVIRRKGIEAIL